MTERVTTQYVYFHMLELITLSSHMSVMVHQLSKTPVSQRSTETLGECSLCSHSIKIFANTMICNLHIPITKGENMGLVYGNKSFILARNTNYIFSIVVTCVKLVISWSRHGFGAVKSAQRLDCLLDY
jgi:hypothetical protein